MPDVATQKAIDVRFTGIAMVGLSGFGLGFYGKLYTTQISGRV